MNNTITIELPDNLIELKPQLQAMAKELFKPEWMLLYKFYEAKQFNIHVKGEAIKISAQVWGE